MDGKFQMADGTLIYIRTSIKSDFKSIRNIDLKSFDPEWTPKKFEVYKESTRVAIIENRIVGFWVATSEADILEQEYIQLLRLAVTPSFRRKRIATALFKDVLANFGHLACQTIITDNQEEGQFFLNNNGFKYLKQSDKINIPGMGLVTSYLFRRDADE